MLLILNNTVIILNNTVIDISLEEVAHILRNEENNYTLHLKNGDNIKITNEEYNQLKEQIKTFYYSGNL